MQPQPGAYPSQQPPPAGYGQPPPPAGYAQPGVYQQSGTTIIQQQPVGPRRYENYAASSSIACGALMIAIGILLIILNSAAISIEAFLAERGNGIGTGIFFIITGIFGILAGRSRTQCPIVAFLVLSILAALGCLNVVIVASIGAACDANDDPTDWNDDCRDAYFVDPDAWPDMDTQDARVGLNATMALLGAIGGIIAIVSSGLGCAGVCCNSRSPSSGAVIMTNQPASTTYITQPGQPAPYGGQTNPGYAMGPPQYNTIPQKS